MIQAIFNYYVTYLSVYPDAEYSLYLYPIKADNCPIFAESFCRAFTKSTLPPNMDNKTMSRAIKLSNNLWEKRKNLLWTGNCCNAMEEKL